MAVSSITKSRSSQGCLHHSESTLCLHMNFEWREAQGMCAQSGIPSKYCHGRKHTGGWVVFQEPSLPSPTQTGEWQECLRRRGLEFGDLNPKSLPWHILAVSDFGKIIQLLWAVLFSSLKWAYYFWRKELMWGLLEIISFRKINLFLLLPIATRTGIKGCRQGPMKTPDLLLWACSSCLNPPLEILLE